MQKPNEEADKAVGREMKRNSVTHKGERLTHSLTHSHSLGGVEKKRN